MGQPGLLIPCTHSEILCFPPCRGSLEAARLLLPAVPELSLSPWHTKPLHTWEGSRRDRERWRRRGGRGGMCWHKGTPSNGVKHSWDSPRGRKKINIRCSPPSRGSGSSLARQQGLCCPTHTETTPSPGNKARLKRKTYWKHHNSVLV